MLDLLSSAGPWYKCSTIVYARRRDSHLHIRVSHRGGLLRMALVRLLVGAVAAEVPEVTVPTGRLGLCSNCQPTGSCAPKPTGFRVAKAAGSDTTKAAGTGLGGVAEGAGPASIPSIARVAGRGAGNLRALHRCVAQMQVPSQMMLHHWCRLVLAWLLPQQLATWAQNRPCVTADCRPGTRMLLSRQNDLAGKMPNKAWALRPFVEMLLRIIS